MRRFRAFACSLLAAAAMTAGCHAVRYVYASLPSPRADGPTGAAVLAPPGYRVEAVATGLNFPSGVVLDDLGRVYALESGDGRDAALAVPRLLRIEPGGRTTVVVEGEHGPWTGVARLRDTFYIAEGGERTGGRILAVGPSGRIEPLVYGLPSVGAHGLGRPAIGADGYLYFGQGSATNSGVVGEDDAA
ncbi:MAG TPA: glucose dehydrogenase, partial [Planctomycetota bacterium]|nr:glucose dehydrogenase [Planctomycetota bacterium]